MAKILPCRKTISMTAVLFVATILPGLAAPKQILLGPTDGGAEQGGQWYSGANGSAYLSVSKTDPHGGDSDYLLGNKTAGDTNRADWRSQVFDLGPAADGAQPITFSFTYKIPGKVNPGDKIEMALRFFDESGETFLGQIPITLGARSDESEMTDYKTVTLANIRSVKNATGVRLPKGARAMTADIWVTCNIFSPWTSGDVRLDDFTVTTVPGPGWLRRHWAVSLTVTLLVIAAALTLAVWAGRPRPA